MGDRAKREYVRKCDKDFLDCISECAKNVIKGNVPLASLFFRHVNVLTLSGKYVSA